jgi:hypothetical protein
MPKPPFIVGAKVAGLWRQTGKKDGNAVTVEPFAALSEHDRRAVETAARRFGRYHQSAVEVR